MTSSATARARSGWRSTRSCTCVGSRAVATTLWPAARTASASARPRPRELPVMSQVWVMVSLLRVRCSPNYRTTFSKLQRMSYQRARRPEQKEERREAILAAARALASERSVRAVSLGDIAREVGLAKSNVLRYFESREEVFLTLLLREWEAWREAGAPGRRRPGPHAGRATAVLRPAGRAGRGARAQHLRRGGARVPGGVDRPRARTRHATSPRRRGCATMTRSRSSPPRCCSPRASTRSPTPPRTSSRSTPRSRGCCNRSSRAACATLLDALIAGFRTRA